MFSMFSLLWRCFWFLIIGFGIWFFFQYLWFKWDNKKYGKSEIYIPKYFLLSIGNMSAGNLLPESLMTVHWPTPSAFCLWPSQFQKLHFCQKVTYDTIDSDSESRFQIEVTSDTLDRLLSFRFGVKWEASNLSD